MVAIALGITEFLLAKQLGKAIFGVLLELTPLDTFPKELTAEWQLCNLAAGNECCAFRVWSDPMVPETEVSFAASGLERLRMKLKKADWMYQHSPGRRRTIFNARPVAVSDRSKPRMPSSSLPAKPGFLLL